MNKPTSFLHALFLRHQMAFRFAFILYAGLVIWASIRPGGGPQPIEHFDKLMHFVFYGLFTIIAAGCSQYKKTFIQLALFVACYGALMEVFQSFVPSRFMSVADIIANTFGVFIVALFFLKSQFHRVE